MANQLEVEILIIIDCLKTYQMENLHSKWCDVTIDSFLYAVGFSSIWFADLVSQTYEFVCATCLFFLENDFLVIIYNLWKITEFSVAEYALYVPTGAQHYPVSYSLQSDKLNVLVH